MDALRVRKLIRDLITEHAFPCEIVAVEDHPKLWRIVIHDLAQRVVTFDIAKTGSDDPAALGDAISARLEEEC
jgi:hypothetical protein